MGAFLFGFLKVQLEVGEVIDGVFLVDQNLLDDPDRFLPPSGSSLPGKNLEADKLEDWGAFLIGFL